MVTLERVEIPARSRFVSHGPRRLSESQHRIRRELSARIQQREAWKVELRLNRVDRESATQPESALQFPA